MEEREGKQGEIAKVMNLETFKVIYLGGLGIFGDAFHGSIQH